MPEELGWTQLINKCGTRAFAQIAGRTPVFVIADAGLLAA
jgi:hypothetical protein